MCITERGGETAMAHNRENNHTRRHPRTLRTGLDNIIMVLLMVMLTLSACDDNRPQTAARETDASAAPQTSVLATAVTGRRVPTPGASSSPVGPMEATAVTEAGVAAIPEVEPYETPLAALGAKA